MTATLEAPAKTKAKAATKAKTEPTPEPTPPPVKGVSFSARALPWTKVGTVIDKAVPIDQALKLGGLDFDVELRKAGFGTGDKKSWRNVPGRGAVVRVDDDRFYDFVSSKNYKIVQFREAFQFLGELNPEISAAGTLGDGRQGFMIVKLPLEHALQLDLGGVVDPHECYVLVRTSHDRSKAIEVSVLMIRGKCMNQLGLNLFTRDAPQRWSIRHVGRPEERLAEAHAVLTGMNRYAAAYVDVARRLHKVQVDDAGAKAILKLVLPDKPRRDDQIKAIIANTHDTPTVGYDGTGWGLLQGVSEYFQWDRDLGTRTDASQFTTTLEGQPRTFLDKTTGLLLSRAA